MPDISGFTNFVKTTEIEHSQHIIEELITIIIREGRKYFDLAEIEGDAVFFYKYNQKLSAEEVAKISERIYIKFNQHLLKYEHQRICSCGACSTAIDLKLKFVVHAGEIKLVKFGQEKAKPFGKPVIVLHRLLKSGINHKEYVLFSNDFLNGESLKADGNSTYQEADLGDIEYQYILIEDWKKKVEYKEEEQKENRADVEVEASQQVEFSADLMHQFISEFKYRKLWNSEADEVIYDEKIINRDGAKHYCIINGNTFTFDSIKLKVDDQIQAYGEVLTNPAAPFKYLETNFIMIPSGENKTDFHFKLKATLKWKVLVVFIPLFKKSLQKKAQFILQEVISSMRSHTKDGVIYSAM